MIRIEVDSKAIKKLLKELVPQFRQELSRKLLGFGRHAQSEVRREILSGTPPPLGIQRIIKGHSRTLIETTDLLRGVAWKYKFGVGRVFGGIEVKIDGPKSKIAAMLHEGSGPFVPSRYQRKAVYAKLPDGEWAQPKKSVWEIPARPFMKNALATEMITRKFAKAVASAINSTLRKYATSSGGGM